MIFKKTFLCGFAIVIFACGGCGPKKPDGFPKLVSCKVTVTKAGRPLDGAVVILSPLSGGGEWITSGKADPSGVALMKTTMKDFTKTGAPEGKFRVVISKRVDVDYEYTPEEAAALSPSELVGVQQRYEKRMEEARIVPAVFESAMLSPAEIEISGSTADYKIELNDYKVK